jgi:hypothetical protein
MTDVSAGPPPTPSHGSTSTLFAELKETADGTTAAEGRPVGNSVAKLGVRESPPCPPMLLFAALGCSAEIGEDGGSSE